MYRLYRITLSCKLLHLQTSHTVASKSRWFQVISFN
ncbi:unnamed protein product [Gongylonema pulchrum]|uniref:Uncharacterized protein n=1 Tax=Gongylonema pulchrum TaxID=637853 RepID=A0A183DKI1_9BILA|nr:unnamed protein product [Gongylonema pulchrum]